jgi:hypothetical protein
MIIALEWWGGNGDAWLLWDPSLDSGPNLAGACGRVDGIIETCKNCNNYPENTSASLRDAY